MALAIVIFTSRALAEEVFTQRPANYFKVRAEKTFAMAESRYQAEPTKAEAVLTFVQAAFDWADLARDSSQREKIALKGIAACRQMIAIEPKSSAAHYYLGMNLGQLARTKTFGALKLIDEMEREFHTAQKLDENFDFAGPNRNLGLLYSEAPGWPTSIGNRSKARHHLQRAVLLQPGYPENRLNLLEASLKWGDRLEARREFNSLKENWSNLRKEFAGEQWELSWMDWEKRWKILLSKSEELERNLDTPRNRK